jgi:hypothetical protein
VLEVEVIARHDAHLAQLGGVPIPGVQIPLADQRIGVRFEHVHRTGKRRVCGIAVPGAEAEIVPQCGEAAVPPRRPGREVGGQPARGAQQLDQGRVVQVVARRQRRGLVGRLVRGQ